MDYEKLELGDSENNLKCAECSKFLSVFPIYLSAEKGNICGRCYDDLLFIKSNYIHNKAFETIANLMPFPCCYKKEGCHEKFLPADMAKHEKTCTYRLVKCPIAEYTNCCWEEALSDTLYHCHEKHSDVMLKNGEFDVNLAQSHDSYNFFEVGSLLLVVTRKFYAINKLLELSIYNLEGEKCLETYTCEINFRSTNRNLTVKCDTSAFSVNKVTEIFLESLKNDVDDTPIVHCTIKLEQTKDETTATKDETVINRELLSLLECANCHTYALPPLYQKISGSSLFVDQKTEIRCEDCQKSYMKMINPKREIFNFKQDEARDYGLEKLAYMVPYPCKYEKNGCSYVAMARAMKTHRDFCLYGQYPCAIAEYIDCKWIGCGRDVTSHIQEVHKIMFIEMSSNISENFSLFRNVKCYIIKCYDKLFQLSFLQKGQSLHWSLQIIGEMDNKYLYELEIINQNRNRCLMARGLCKSWQKKDQLFAFGGDGSFAVVLLESFMSNGSINFKLRILKG